MSNGDDAARKQRQKEFYTRQREEAEHGAVEGDVASAQRLQKIRSKLGKSGSQTIDSDISRIQAARKKSMRQK